MRESQAHRYRIMKKPWTSAELEILKAEKLAGKPGKEIAAILNRSLASVDCQLKALGLTQAAVVKPTTLKQDIIVKDEQFWKRQHAELNKKYQGLLTEKSAVDRLVGSVRDMAPKSYSAAPGV